MRLLIVEPIEEKIFFDFKQKFERAGIDIIYQPDLDELTMLQQLIDKKIEALLIGSQKFPREFIEKWAKEVTSSRKSIIRAGSNTSTIDTEAAASFGIPVMNTAGVNSISVAHNIMTVIFMLASQNQLTKSMQAIKEHRILPRQEYRRIALWNKKIALIGFGFVGTKVAKMANAAGMRVVAYTPSLTDERAAEFGAIKSTSLEDALTEANVLCIQSPYILSEKESASTHHLLKERELFLLAKGAIVVNVGRAQIIDMHAIESGLVSGQLSGFALDTYPAEVSELSLKYPRIFSHENVIITPCIYTAYFETFRDVSHHALLRVYSYYVENTAIDIVNPHFIDSKHTLSTVSLLCTPQSSVGFFVRKKSEKPGYAIPRIGALTRESILQAYMKMPSYIEAPKIEHVDYLSERLGATIHLLRADQGAVRSYKDRGAFFKISHVVESLLLSQHTGVFEMIAASEGNHAQGVAKAVAYFSKLLEEKKSGLRILGKIYMPETTPQIKIDKAVALGAGAVSVELVSGLFENADQMAKKHVQISPGSAIYVPPFDDLDVIKGQGTLWPGIEESYDEIIMTTGGGGLLSSAVVYFEPESVKLRGVQPAWVPSMLVALCAGHPVELEQHDIEKHIHYPLTVDGATISKAGDFTHAIIANKRACLETVSKNQLAFSFYEFVHRHAKNSDGSINYSRVPELAGLLPITFLYKLHHLTPSYFKGKKVLCVITGSNIASKKIDDLLTFVTQEKVLTSNPFAEYTPFFDNNDIKGSYLSLKNWISDESFSQLTDELGFEPNPHESLRKLTAKL